MKANSKILLTIGLLVVVTGGVFASIKYNQRGIVDVQTGRAVRQGQMEDDHVRRTRDVT